jgi:hypothetical protein
MLASMIDIDKSYELVSGIKRQYQMESGQEHVPRSRQTSQLSRQSKDEKNLLNIDIRKRPDIGSSRRNSLSRGGRDNSKSP